MKELKEEPTDRVGVVTVPQAGSVVGGYELLHRLGGGAHASVWSATRNGQRYALKIFSLDGSLDPLGALRLRNEARTLSRLRHPHIVRGFGFISEGPMVGLVMEELHGRDLRRELQSRVIRGQPCPVTEVDAWCRQVAEALDHAHASGVVHRDLKPENVFLQEGSEPAAKLLDFGWSKVVHDTSAETTLGRQLGAWEYMSPEQAAGRPVVPASDRFSLATLLFEALTLRRPFIRDPKGTPRPTSDEGTGGPDLTDLIRRLLFDPRPSVHRLRPDLPRELDGFFERAWAPQPEARFASCAELAEAFCLSVGLPPPLPSTKIHFVHGGGPSAPASGWSRLQPGTWVGPYRLESSLESEPDRAVWSAQDVRTQETVRITLRPHSSERDVLLYDEVRAHGALDHPVIEPLLDHGRCRDLLYLVTPFEESISVQRLMEGAEAEQRPFTDMEVAYLLVEVAAALDHAFYQALLDDAPVALVHRNLSPKCISIRADGGVRIRNFELAQTELRSEVPDRVEPEPALFRADRYRSPEVSAGGSADIRSDFYSLGKIGHDLLSAGISADGSVTYSELRDVLSDMVRERREERPASYRALRKLMPAMDAPSLEAARQRLSARLASDPAASTRVRVHPSNERDGRDMGTAVADARPRRERAFVGLAVVGWGALLVGLWMLGR